MSLSCLERSSSNFQKLIPVPHIRKAVTNTEESLQSIRFWKVKRERERQPAPKSHLLDTLVMKVCSQRTSFKTSPFHCKALWLVGLNIQGNNKQPCDPLVERPWKKKSAWSLCWLGRSIHLVITRQHHSQSQYLFSH